uniref:Uncharacterized protein n=1 Tax=Heterorhabditis bacteriophora TaxID=37862 RepID=A0A1I7WJJ6_HETBA
MLSSSENFLKIRNNSRKKYEGVRSPQPYNSSNLDALMHTAIAQILFTLFILVLFSMMFI